MASPEKRIHSSSNESFQLISDDQSAVDQIYVNVSVQESQVTGTEISFMMTDPASIADKDSAKSGATLESGCDHHDDDSDVDNNLEDKIKDLRLKYNNSERVYFKDAVKFGVQLILPPEFFDSIDIMSMLGLERHINEVASVHYKAFFSHLCSLSELNGDYWTLAIKNFCNENEGEGNFFKKASFPLKKRWNLRLTRVFGQQSKDMFCIIYPSRLMELLGSDGKLNYWRKSLDSEEVATPNLLYDYLIKKKNPVRN